MFHMKHCFFIVSVLAQGTVHCCGVSQKKNIALRNKKLLACRWLIFVTQEFMNGQNFDKTCFCEEF